MSRESDALIAGVAAAEKNRNAKEWCPYVEGTDEWSFWMTGYNGQTTVALLEKAERERENCERDCASWRAQWAEVIGERDKLSARADRAEGRARMWKKGLTRERRECRKALSETIEVAIRFRESAELKYEALMTTLHAELEHVRRAEAELEVLQEVAKASDALFQASCPIGGARPSELWGRLSEALTKLDTFRTAKGGG